MFLWLCSLVLLEHCWWEVPKQNILKQNMFLTTTFSDVGHVHHRSIAENCSDRVAYGNLVNPSSDCCFSGWDPLGACCTVNGVVQLYVAPAYAMIHHFHLFTSSSHKRQLSLVPCSHWCHPTEIPCFLPPVLFPFSITPWIAHSYLCSEYSFHFFPKQTITFFVSCFKSSFLSIPVVLHTFTYIHW